jgi:murein DD-endopeptidase MepM/ murein hydrolase activator NlpD
LWAFQAESQTQLSRLVAARLLLGARRLSVLAPALLRLLRWETQRLFSDFDIHVERHLGRRGERRVALRRTAKRLLPMLSVLLASVACSLVSGGGDEQDPLLSVNPLAPDLSKPKRSSPPTARRDAPWAYVLPVDHGVRSDESGQGYFRAPRFHGEHNGLDLLAPVGTPVFSPCEGQAMAGASRSFGRWIHVICPVPEEYRKAGAARPWASFFYAHLDKTDLPFNQWVDVAKAEAVGQVGKSGNARGPNIQPHLHLELIVQKNRRSAMDERHLGKDQSAVAAADHFADQLSSQCMAPFGFQAKSQMLRRARRLDPFIALTCLSSYKPNFIKAPSPLTDSSRAWTQYYVAKDFNVNLGVEDSKLAAR